MRKAPAFHEAILWKLLRDRRLAHLKFRRQVPLGRYIADFLCLEHRIIVEADGPLHDPVKDAERDAWLNGQGFRVLRFPNATILASPGLVLTAILDAARPPPHPSASPPPSPARGEGNLAAASPDRPPT
ncbi:MAG: endonuclease domain-containing protein [Caulobacter sp.]|nr:endonuclease domain-containing protein [Caulobacter sp.]